MAGCVTQRFCSHGEMNGWSIGPLFYLLVFKISEKWTLKTISYIYRYHGITSYHFISCDVIITPSLYVNVCDIFQVLHTEVQVS